MSFFSHSSATSDRYTLSLHDALPIYARSDQFAFCLSLWEALDADPFGEMTSSDDAGVVELVISPNGSASSASRSEEHTSELQSRRDLVCRLLLENKKKKITYSFDVR